MVRTMVSLNLDVENEKEYYVEIVDPCGNICEIPYNELEEVIKLLQKAEKAIKHYKENR